VHVLAALILAFGGAPSVSVARGIPTITWSLASGEYVNNVEIATSPKLYPSDQFLLGGSFVRNVYVERLFPDARPATSLTPRPYRNGIPLPNGTYYVHVHYVSGCSTWDRCTSDNWSPIVSFAVRDTARPTRKGPPNSLTARLFRLPGRFPHLQLRGQLHVAQPEGCPVRDPGIGNSQLAWQWGSPYCTDYVRQGADVRLRVVRAGRIVQSEQHAAYGPAWQADLFPTLFSGGCKSGGYRWTVTLADPYFRPDVSVSGSFTAHC